MKTTEEVVEHVRSWALDRIESYNALGVDRIYDQMAIIDEFHEWLIPEDEDIDIISIDEITEEEYNDYKERS